jgi:hypothetical protein
MQGFWNAYIFLRTRFCLIRKRHPNLTHLTVFRLTVFVAKGVTDISIPEETSYQRGQIAAFFSLQRGLRNDTSEGSSQDGKGCCLVGEA